MHKANRCRRSRTPVGLAAISLVIVLLRRVIGPDLLLRRCWQHLFAPMGPLALSRACVPGQPQSPWCL